MDKDYIAERKKAIVTDSMAHGLGGYVSQFVGFFISIFIRRFLGPFYTGIWSLLKVVLNYSLYADLGSEFAIFYKIPLFAGKGDEKEADNVQNIVGSYMAVVTIPVSICILAAAFILKGRMSHELFIGFLLFPLMYIGQRFYTYLITLMRARKKFIILGKSYIFDSVVDLILVILLVSRFKLYGMYLVGVALPLFNILYIQYNARFRFKFKLLWGKVGEYIVFGFPIFLTACMNVILYSVDSLMVAKMLSIVHLGYYSIAIMSRSYTLGISKSFASVISPYFIEDFSKTEDFSKIKYYVTTYSEILACLVAVILGFIYIGFPVLVYYAVPKFLPGISAMKAMLISTFFMLISWQLQNILVIKKKQMIMVAAVFSAIIINIICNYLCIRYGLGITGVAASSSFAAFLVFVAFSVLGMYYLKAVNKLGSFFLRIFIPFLLTAAVLFLIERSITAANPIAACSLSLLLFSAYSSAVVFYLNKRAGLVNIVVSIIREKIPRKRQ